MVWVFWMLTSREREKGEVGRGELEGEMVAGPRVRATAKP